jgi:cobalt-zinc-cadmium efflux system membrane fusion protein
LTTRNLARLRELYKTLAVSQRDLEQATSDQQTAEGNLRAARDAVRIFGKTDAESIASSPTAAADPTLVVPSPITAGSRRAMRRPGCSCSQATRRRLYRRRHQHHVDAGECSRGRQSGVSRRPAVQVKLSAFPGRVFDGKITTIGASVDPNTRRVLVRSEINDPQHELRSGMFANFVISVGAPVRSPAVPLDGVVREGDGTMTVWVTADRRRFTKRTVKIGDQRDGYRQILEGVQVGELVATDGAIFLSNMLAIAGSQ